MPHTIGVDSYWITPITFDHNVILISENGLFKFRYFHPRTTPLLSPKRICEMNAIVDGDDLKVTVTG